jgi:hypothetical protein
MDGYVFRRLLCFPFFGCQIEDANVLSGNYRACEVFGANLTKGIDGCIFRRLVYFPNFGWQIADSNVLKGNYQVCNVFGANLTKNIDGNVFGRLSCFPIFVPDHNIQRGSPEGIMIILVSNRIGKGKRQDCPQANAIDLADFLTGLWRR